MRSFENNYHFLPLQNVRELYTFNDDSVILFSTGNFDEYKLTYLPNGQNLTYGHSPKDDIYLEDLLTLSGTFGKEVIWNDFFNISDAVVENGRHNHGFPSYDANEIRNISVNLTHLVEKYPHQNQNDIFKLYFIIWGVMISEWYHFYYGKPSILKHTPKIIAFYQIMEEDFSPTNAAKFSQNKSVLKSFILEKYSKKETQLSPNKMLMLVMDVYNIQYDWIFDINYNNNDLDLD